MDIATLRAFIAVAQYESFSIAAEKLHITQPAVSKRVAALETELGIELFNRIARQISLTQAGQQLLPKALELVNQAKDMVRVASNHSANVSGVLSIAISHHVGLHRMPPILKEFHQNYQQVELDIRFEDSERALHGVEQGEIEFAVITLPNQLPKNLIAQSVWQDDLMIVVALHHPLSENKQTTFEQLSNFLSVLPSRETETYRVIARQFEQRQLSFQTQMSTNNLETLKMLAIAGVGWSLLPASMLNQELVTIDVDESLVRQLGLVYHRKRSLTNAARTLKSLILQEN